MFSRSNSPVVSSCPAQHDVQGLSKALAMRTPWQRAAGPAGARSPAEDSEALMLHAPPLARSRRWCCALHTHKHRYRAP